ncbi:pantothenate:Na+ symporter [Geomicrobium sp. JCM 19037]|nr:pantothenate:Na+ symporter [Geomicrobium sp. JCM 19037]
MNWDVMIPLIIFVVLVFAIGFWSSRKVYAKSNFMQEYFLGSRELGGLILAMTMIATYGSASSFVGGPGAAYTEGLVGAIIYGTSGDWIFYTYDIRKEVCNYGEALRRCHDCRLYEGKIR